MEVDSCGKPEYVKTILQLARLLQDELERSAQNAWAPGVWMPCPAQAHWQAADLALRAAARVQKAAPEICRDWKGGVVAGAAVPLRAFRPGRIASGPSGGGQDTETDKAALPVSVQAKPDRASRPKKRSKTSQGRASQLNVGEEQPDQSWVQCQACCTWKWLLKKEDA